MRQIGSHTSPTSPHAEPSSDYSHSYETVHQRLHRLHDNDTFLIMALKVISRSFLFAILVILSVMFRGSLSSSLKMLDNRACFGAGNRELQQKKRND